MHRFLLTGFLFVLLTWNSTAAEEHRWPLDSVDPETLQVHGHPRIAEGARGNCLAFDGQSMLEIRDSAPLPHGSENITLTVWVNPYVLDGQQQMIAAKNRYSLNEREWGVMIDKDNRFRLYVWQGKWVTIAAEEMPRPGHWHQVGVLLRPGRAELWVNGRPVGDAKLEQPIPQTSAPVTLGGVNDNGRVWQNFVGAIDDVRLVDRPLGESEMTATYSPVEATHEIPDFASRMDVVPEATWRQQIAEHARQDRIQVVFDGKRPDTLACDTTLRNMPDGSWVMIMLGGGHTEPLPENRIYIARSHDDGKTWSNVEPIDLGVKTESPSTALVPSELMVHGDRCTMFVSTHDGTFANWKEWMTVSEDSCRTWSELRPAPGRLHDRTFIRNHIVTRDGRILLPFQHYQRVAATREISKNRRFSAPTDPRNGVLMSSDGGKTWTEHGDIRISSKDDYHGWAENNIVELSDGRIAMIIRADGLGGVLYYAESTDGGRTWPEYARKTTIPNPGSKATLYSLGGDNVALLHNPNPRHRSPLSLWVSFDGMQSWPYQRVLVPESVDGPRGRLNYPDGFVSEDGRFLHFAFDDNRHRGVVYSARLPEVPREVSLWSHRESIPAASEAEVLKDVEFHVIKKWEPAVDGYSWLHGVALAWHKGQLFASFGHNKGKENTVTEEARYCVSDDGGRTWSDVRPIDIGTDEDDLAVSHGLFLSRGDELWAFLGAFHNTRQRVHTRAYTFDERNDRWQPRGVVVDAGFWPMTEPVKLDDGNWLMPGLIAGGGNPAAVAISQGEDLTSWRPVVIPRGPGVRRMWGESSVVVDGPRVTNIARYGGKALALVAVSEDFGQTWSPSVESDLPMATSKPCAGVLSTGQRYLICTTTSDSGGRRSPLTIAVSRPGEETFSKVFVIRHAESPDGPGESHPNAKLSYPYATEHAGKLYVGYSNSHARGGNQNSAELAVIPVAGLRVDDPD